MGGASFGPALPHLARSTGATLSAISYLFVAHRIGFVLGALLAGRLYDRVRGHRVFGVALLVMALALTLLPHAGSLALLLGVAFIVGAMAGGVDVGGNVLLVWRVREGLGPFMSFLHFTFGVGTFLAPVFLAQSLAWSAGIAWGYAALALLTVPVAILVLLRPSPTRGSSDTDEQTPKAGLVALTAVFLVLYVAAEVGFGNWIYTYAVTAGLADEVTSGYLTSAYWGAYTVGRLISVVVAARTGPGRLLGVCLAAAAASLIALLMIPSGAIAMWATTIVLGLALAPMFPVMITFASERTVITGGVTSLFLVGASVGAMSLPWLIGQLFSSRGPSVVPALVLIDVVLLAAVFALVVALYGGAVYPDRGKLKKPRR